MSLSVFRPGNNNRQPRIPINFDRTFSKGDSTIIITDKTKAPRQEGKTLYIPFNSGTGRVLQPGTKQLLTRQIYEASLLEEGWQRS